MRSIFLKIIIICALLFYAIYVQADEILKYEVTPNKIKRICMSKIKEGRYLVVIELNLADKKNFSRLTEQNVGKILEIDSAGQILTKATIKGKIDSGSISIEYDSKEDLKKILNILN